MNAPARSTDTTPALDPQQLSDATRLGARAVSLGKLQGWALAAAGEAGVARMLEIMEAEIRTTLSLMGIRSLSELAPSWVVPVPPLSDGSVTSAFPIFEEQRRH